MDRIEDEVRSTTEVDFTDSTCKDKQTFEINEIGYKVQVSMTKINAESRSTVGVHFTAETCMRDKIVRVVKSCGTPHFGGRRSWHSFDIWIKLIS